ncbi:protein monoglycylase TTLL8 isoform X2 [Tachyglossus aculeatus]|uniref:protein monoglycylase TTLL8 isoform X2 n=1 Tax=Tachyglossus aculeatus TaxID=9261 RepID=UPI0018F57A30|nr:protein monoglycylase TTLL8 isoform X2 [Tachyglossus aculeatus]
MRKGGPLAPAIMNESHTTKRRFSLASCDEERKENMPKRGLSLESTHFPRLDRYKQAKHLSEKAIKEKKIFTIFGHYPVIRACLQRRGWVEKKFHPLCKGVQDGSHSVNGRVKDENRPDRREERESFNDESHGIHDVMSRLVKDETPHLLWTIRRDVIDAHGLHGDQMLNHYGKTTSFTTKIGLCLNLRDLPWYVQANPNSFFPRCYNLCTEDEKQDFLGGPLALSALHRPPQGPIATISDDFRRTVASSILKWVVSYHTCGKSKPKSRKEGSGHEEPCRKTDPAPWEEKKRKCLPGRLIDAACQVCETYLGRLEHRDIDGAADGPDGPDGHTSLSEPQWAELIQQYYCLIHDDAFICNSRDYIPQCQTILNKITSVNPQLEIDGMQSIWIIKPGAKSRGRDIVCMDRVEDILGLVSSTEQASAKDKWVVQKYIETPLLIYDTKFDIRQWFLVTDWNPLTVWFYKESYLRFSTQRFSLDSLDSSIHLCNNSVQKHLVNAADRSPQLPAYNMWTSTRFREYLQRKGRGGVWQAVIYPAMKRAVGHALKVAQDHVEPRRNSFELYGADFILGKDFRPWLIEINSSPTMLPSTPVTAQLCAQVQEDTVRVVIDRKLDRNCDIGNFELLWKQPMVALPRFSGSSLCVEGVSLQKSRKPQASICTVNLLGQLASTQAPRGPVPAGGRTHVPEPVRPRAACHPGKWKGEKVVSCSLPEPGRGPPDGSCRASKVEFPAVPFRAEENISRSPQRLLAARPQNLPNTGAPVSPAALVLRNLKIRDRSWFRPAKGSGFPRSLKNPCLVCRRTFQLEKSCKHCSSFHATVFQEGAFIPLTAQGSLVKKAANSGWGAQKTARP